MIQNVPALIQAGGFGTRIRSLFRDIPKPLVPILGHPVLFRQIDWLHENGIFEIYILAGYLADQISHAVKDEYNDPQIRILVEQTPLGSGGCLSLVRDYLKSTVLVISADVIFDFQIEPLIKRHKLANADITLTLYATSNPFDGDLVKIDDDSNVRCLMMRPHSDSLIFENRVNAAASVVEPSIIHKLPVGKMLSFEADIVQGCLNRGGLVATYTPKGYIKDIGTPVRWEEANRDLSHDLKPKDKVHVVNLKSLFHLENSNGEFFSLRHRDFSSKFHTELDQIKSKSNEGFIVVGLLPHVVENTKDFRIAELDTLLAKQSLKIDYYITDSQFIK